MSVCAAPSAQPDRLEQRGSKQVVEALGWKLRVHRDDGEACHPVHLGESKQACEAGRRLLSGMPSRFELSTSGIDLVLAPIDLGADFVGGGYATHLREPGRRPRQTAAP
jgi:hypothetical protein